MIVDGLLEDADVVEEVHRDLRAATLRGLNQQVASVRRKDIGSSQADINRKRQVLCRVRLINRLGHHFPPMNRCSIGTPIFVAHSMPLVIPELMPRSS